MPIVEERRITKRWYRGLRYAEEYFKTYGHLDVPARYKCPDGYPLGKWLVTQRFASRPGTNQTITVEQMMELDALGMDWGESVQEAWDAGIAHAAAYRSRYGTVNAPKAYVCPDGYPLGKWLTQARYLHRKPKDGRGISLQNERALEALGIDWLLSNEEMWEEGYRHAKRLHDDGVDLNAVVRVAKCVDGFHIGEWLYTQKYRHNGAPGCRPSPLPTEKAMRLEALGFRWDQKCRRGNNHLSEI